MVLMLHAVLNTRPQYSRSPRSERWCHWHMDPWQQQSLLAKGYLTDAHWGRSNSDLGLQFEREYADGKSNKLGWDLAPCSDTYWGIAMRPRGGSFFGQSLSGSSCSQFPLTWSSKLFRDAVKRPIIFICHSLGGIAVKKCLYLPWASVL